MLNSLVNYILQRITKKIVSCDALEILSHECDALSALNILCNLSKGHIEHPSEYIVSEIRNGKQQSTSQQYENALSILIKVKLLNPRAYDKLRGDGHQNGIPAIKSLFSAFEGTTKRVSRELVSKKLLQCQPKARSQPSFAYAKKLLQYQPKARSQPKFAYVTVLWSDGRDSTSLVLDAIVLGMSLLTCCKHDRILLATREIAHSPFAAALGKFWTVREIEHVEIAHDKLYCDERFKHVFTKLLVLDQTDYQKIVLMDSDLLVTRNVDELFDHPAPAALWRGHSDHTPDTIRQNYTKGGINGGVVILEPSAEVLRLMCKTLRGEIRDSTWEALLAKSTGPEQDFLGHWYGRRAKKMKGLHPKYNYQLHQLFFEPDLANDRTRLRFDDINILHFSTKHKPSKFALVQDKEDYQQWLREMFNIRGARATPESHRHVFAIVEKATTAWLQMWGTAWNHLLSGLTEELNSQTRSTYGCPPRGATITKALKFLATCKERPAKRKPEHESFIIVSSDDSDSDSNKFSHSLPAKSARTSRCRQVAKKIKRKIWTLNKERQAPERLIENGDQQILRSSTRPALQTRPASDFDARKEDEQNELAGGKDSYANEVSGRAVAHEGNEEMKVEQVNPEAVLESMVFPKSPKEWEMVQDVVFAGHPRLPEGWIRQMSRFKKCIYYVRLADNKKVLHLEGVR